MSARKSRWTRLGSAPELSSPERVVSALIQASLARDLGGNQTAMAEAFLIEFSADIAAAQARGPKVAGEVMWGIAADLAEVALATAAHAANTSGTTPTELLSELLAAYREAPSST